MPRRFLSIFFWMAFVGFGLLFVLMLFGFGLAPVRYTSAQFLNGLHEQITQMEWNKEEGRPTPRDSRRPAARPNRPAPAVRPPADLKPAPVVPAPALRAPSAPPASPAAPAAPAAAPAPTPAPSVPAVINKIYIYPPSAPTPTDLTPSPAAPVPPVAPTQPQSRSQYCPRGQVCTADGLVISQPQPIPSTERVQARQTINILSGNSLGLNINVLGAQGHVPSYGSYGYDSSVMGHMERVCEPLPTGCYNRWIGHRPPGTSPY